MSTIKTDNLQNAAGSLSVPVATVVNGCAKAWVNFDGTFGTSPFIANNGIRAAFNVSSVTDNGTGTYTVNFATALQDANYTVAGMAESTSTSSSNFTIFPRLDRIVTSSQYGINTGDSNGVKDSVRVSLQFFR